MRTFKVYTTNIGLFIESSSYGMDKLKINGNMLNPANNGYRYISDTSIDSCEILKEAQKIVIGYKLINPLLVSVNIPSFLSVEDVNQKYIRDDDDNGDWSYRWDIKWESIRSLYFQETKECPPEWVTEEFEVKVIRNLDISSYNKPIEMKVGINEGSLGGNKNTYDLSTIVSYSDIELMLTPEFLLHERPCKLTSRQVYSIIRMYVKENIDPKYARITSDYEFCFTVKRLVSIKPYIHTSETKKPNGRSYATPKYKKNTISNVEIEIFEMTSDKDRYSNYTVIGAWEANNLLDMKNQIEYYLSELMMHINSPTTQCTHCGGNGHVSVDKIKTNERNL